MDVSFVEGVVTGIWKDILEYDDLDGDSNFFNIGGDSIMALNMLFEVGAAFKIDLPPSVLFDFPSLGSFSAYVSGILIE